MPRLFDEHQLEKLLKAADVAEDAVADHFHHSSSHWDRIGLELVSGEHLAAHEMLPHVFAQVLCYLVQKEDVRPQDHYRICVQDHNILRALDGEARDIFFPLLVYVLTHELIHVVRFTRFLQLYQADPDRKEREEITVHGLTHEILNKRNLENMPLVLEFYGHHAQAHRWPRVVRT
ncbi:MAG: hypothetical protein KJ621_17150 [Proteobacteria bacterium]|nr:hypothetical protein [Pseudomonadota bacterium]MBU1741673.1 hypothetical protein [Pseudomonadota bacterium]